MSSTQSYTVVTLCRPVLLRVLRLENLLVWCLGSELYLWPCVLSFSLKPIGRGSFAHLILYYYLFIRLLLSFWFLYKTIQETMLRLSCSGCGCWPGLLQQLMDSLTVKSYFWSISWYQASPVQAIKGRSHVELPHCLWLCPQASFLRFHVDLPSNGWLRQDQKGQAQPRRHKGPGNFKEKTLFINILALFSQRNSGDVAFTYFSNLASQRPLESTVLNLPRCESSPLIEAVALFVDRRSCIVPLGPTWEILLFV